MIECFISHVVLEHRNCRYCDTKGVLTVSERKTKECFNAFSSDCESCDCERNCSRKFSCKSFPIMCIAESCPPQKKFYDGRCKLVFWHKKQIDYFEEKSDIKNYPDFEWHKPDSELHRAISSGTMDKEDEYKHHEWIRQFHTDNANHKQWLRTMREFYTVAQTILDMRRGEPEEVKPIDYPVVDYLRQPQTRMPGEDMPQSAEKSERITRPQKSLSELIETKVFIKIITPLPKYDTPNSKWITAKEAAKLLGISEGRLGNLRIKNESVDYNKCKTCEHFTGNIDCLKCANCTIRGDIGFLIFRSENGLIWCKSSQTSKGIFYLLSELTKLIKTKK